MLARSILGNVLTTLTSQYVLTGRTRHPHETYDLKHEKFEQTWIDQRWAEFFLSVNGTPCATNAFTLPNPSGWTKGRRRVIWPASFSVMNDRQPRIYWHNKCQYIFCLPLRLRDQPKNLGADWAIRPQQKISTSQSGAGSQLGRWTRLAYGRLSRLLGKSAQQSPGLAENHIIINFNI